MDPSGKVQDFFHYFEAQVTNIEISYDPISLYAYGSPISQNAIGKEKMTMTTVFYSRRGADLFVNFLENLEKEREEYLLRERNPTLRKAYEEYQILLKLIK